MNIKSLLAIAGITATSVALATVTSQNTLSRIAVNSTAKSIILALPLQTVGNAASDKSIKVTDLVMTTNLDAGDSLVYWNGSQWVAWSFNGTAWESTTSVTGFTETYGLGPNTALPCGKAVWLNRPDPAGGTRTKSRDLPVYLYGQYFGAGAVVEAVARAQTLIGPCVSSPIKINEIVSKKTAGAFNDGDQIVVADPNNTVSGRATYTYKGTVGETEINNFAQYKRVNGSREWVVPADSVTLPVGQGFWYVSTGESAPTFTW